MKTKTRQRRDKDKDEDENEIKTKTRQRRDETIPQPAWFSKHTSLQVKERSDWLAIKTRNATWLHCTVNQHPAASVS